MLFTIGQSGSGNAIPWIKVVFFAIVIGFSAISWIIRKLAEQKAIRDAKQAREQAREQMLRTGRTEAQFPEAQASQPEMMMQMPPTSSDDAKRRLMEIAAKRRAELERLARASGGGSSAPVAPPAPMPQRTVQPAQYQKQAPTARGMAAPVDLRRQREEEERRKAANQKAARKGAEAEKRKAAAASKVRAKEASVRADEAGQSDYQEQLAMEARRAASAMQGTPGTQPKPGATPMAASQGLSTLDAALARTAPGTGPGSDWRRAFVLSELLRPPLSERQ